MLTLIVGTVILALVYGASWHDQPAGGQDRERGDNQHGTTLSGTLPGKPPTRRARQ